ncbi:glycosyltransferase family 1 protein [Microbacterium sp. APC 3898]|uniref:Glycosyltransferase family 1 protein n=1 Tax=Planococcus notacanthi TaxID=3035188 RepID=A0ABT7ZMG8_9BACL|nr:MULTISPECIES: glycosyltransferase family 1 protein [Terrabacteria group]MDN3428375.1 glycosyltransferase family 1 protein [Planococcus sp. APC 4016]MDN3498918.1 glycosyltransferase family 1 protein [Microbacterium sp. APC 3898]
MKIMIVTETFLPSTDGIVTRLTACIRWLHRDGHEVQIVAPDLGVREFDGAFIKGVPAFAFPFYRSKKFAFPNPVVKKYMAAFNPDIVHVVNPAVVGYSGVTYAKELDIPLIASYHTHIPQYMSYYKLGKLDWLMWWFMKKMHNQADLNLCTSHTVLEELNKKGFERMQVWKRGVDTQQFHPKHSSTAMRSRLSGGQPDKILLLYVGRLAAEKEIEKIRDVLTASNQFCLALVGDGPHRKQLEKHFAGTPTVFTGFIHGQELASAFASSDAFIFPSTTETLGLVIMEAMASGLPVVAAESGPTKEQVTHQRNGLLYNSKDPDSFKETIHLLENSVFRKQLAQQAVADVAELGWAAAAEQIRDLYRQVADAKTANSLEAAE